VGYDAYISYSHGAEDAAVAASIEQGLERLARPWNRLRAMSVFRDQSDLTAESDLSGALTRTLGESRYLVLLASPESAASPWVNKEVAYWCDQCDGVERLIVVVTGGVFEWDEGAGALTQSTDAVSTVVRSRFTTEPLYVDLRWARAAQELSLRDTRFRAAIVLMAATIRGVAPADLEGEDVRLHRRARRLARAAVATVAVLALVASVAALVAVANAARADRRARDALGRQLGLTALDLPTSEVDEALLLSLVAADLDSGDGAERFQASRALIGRYSRLDRLLHAPTGTTSVRGVVISPDDRWIVAVVTGADGAATLLQWASGSRTDPLVTPLPDDVAPAVRLLADGRAMVGDPGGAMTVLSPEHPEAAEELGVVLAVDTVDSVAAVAGDGATIDVIDLGSGGRRATVESGSTIVDARHGRVAVATDEGPILVEAGDAARPLVGLRSPAPTTAIAAGPTADVVAVTASTDAIVPWRLLDGALASGAAVAVPDGVGEPVWLAVAPDGARVLVVGTAGSSVVGLGTRATDAVDRGATGRVAVDPSGRYAAVGGARLTVWDLSTGRAMFAVPVPANAMAWSGPCDEEIRCKLVTAGESLDVWDPATRRHVQLMDQTNAQSVTISQRERPS